MASEPVQIAIPYTPLTLTLEHTEPSDHLIGRFFEEVVASDSLVFDRFASPSAQLALAQRQIGLGYGELDRLNGEGARLFSRIGLDSLRTAAMEALPLGLWQDYWQPRLVNFIVGTFGNPQEEHVFQLMILDVAPRLENESRQLISEQPDSVIEPALLRMQQT